jgi:transcriptional regulator with XRE-family HTH domain
MAKKFSTLEKKMNPERLARAKARAKEVMADMLLSEIRREMKLTQEDLAESLGIKQPSLSKLETQDDMQISTLRRIVQALGGKLELVAHLPQGDIRISQFAD